jgi:hypothetical protein
MQIISLSTNRLKSWRTVLEIAGAVALAGAGAFFIATSWRKWPDPLLDFGQQLYNAWQLSNGAVLYRDVGCIYGPLSEYLNAGVFRLFGPGLVVLAIANLIIFAAITVSIYLLIRKCWSVLAAWLSTLIFISVFGFSQFVDAGNYNYATPYANETIHGMLISLLLCYALFTWANSPTAARSLVCGLLLGATLVLKPEFIFAAVLMTCVAAFARWRWRGLPEIGVFAGWMIGVLLPSAVFAIYFAQFLPWHRAFLVTSQAWLSAFNPSFNSSPLATRLLGFDEPWSRLAAGLTATGLACAVIFFLVGTLFLFERNRQKWIRLTIASALVLIFAWLGVREIMWEEIGKCLSGLTLIYCLISGVAFLRNTKQSTVDLRVGILRLLLAGLALTFLMRMFLNPRIYHYGYYQAALAAVLIPAVMIGELPDWFQTTGWQARGLAAVATLAVVLPGAAKLAIRSQNALRLKTETVASGRDRFYCFPAGMDPTGALVNAVVNVLQEKASGGTVTLLPEGESINYFARLRNPVPHACFYQGAMETETETELVSDLQKQSPDWIVIISRDLIAWGIERYGEKSGAGQEVLHWVEQNYDKVAWTGGDPLDYREHGAIILRKQSP